MDLKLERQLNALHAEARKARDKAHEAYQRALARNREAGDTQPAFDALLLANQVMKMTSDMQIANIRGDYVITVRPS